MKFRYTPKFRPPCSATLPHNLAWELVERGINHDVPLRTDLPFGKHRFGVIEIGRRLTEDECRSFQLDHL